MLLLDRLRPWLAHAFHRSPLVDVRSEVYDLLGTQGAPVLIISGQMILTTDAAAVFQSAGLEHILEILAGDRGDYTRSLPVRNRLPLSILELVRRIVGAANGGSSK